MKMAHKLKEPEARKADIIDAAEKLFFTKGYGATTTGDILEKAGIARGTLYYYFKSKEEIMDAVVERSIERQIQALLPIVEDKQLNAIQKFKQIIHENSQKNEGKEEMLDYLHRPENIAMHHKSLIAAVCKFAPYLAKIIRQGISEKLFQTEYPLELAEFLMVGMNFLFDTAIFPGSIEEYIARMRALADVLEAALRAEKGSFDFLVTFTQERM